MINRRSSLAAAAGSPLLVGVGTLGGGSAIEAASARWMALLRELDDVYVHRSAIEPLAFKQAPAAVALMARIDAGIDQICDQKEVCIEVLLKTPAVTLSEAVAKLAVVESRLSDEPFNDEHTLVADVLRALRAD